MKSPLWKKKKIKNQRVDSIIDSAKNLPYTDGAIQAIYEYIVELEAKLEQKEVGVCSCQK